MRHGERPTVARHLSVVESDAPLDRGSRRAFVGSLEHHSSKPSRHPLLFFCRRVDTLPLYTAAFHLRRTYVLKPRVHVSVTLYTCQSLCTRVSHFVHVSVIERLFLKVERSNERTNERANDVDQTMPPPPFHSLARHHVELVRVELPLKQRAFT